MAISLKSSLSRVLARFLFRTGGHLQLPVLRSAFSESDDHYRKYINLGFVHSSTITYESLEEINGSKFGAERFALQCFYYSTAFAIGSVAFLKKKKNRYGSRNFNIARSVRAKRTENFRPRPPLNGPHPL